MTQIVSSISGLQVYAPSAGFAPTNSADVSAIASGYQVVSSTGTQLYAGTAFLTGVNGAPVSASRAGNAANAGMANSAYYDGTGRLISALPDSTAVSGIASSYAESAASGKQDTLSFGYDASDNISAINGSALAGGGGATGDYLTSKVGSGQATFTTAFQDGLDKRPALIISSERTADVKIYPRMMITDWNGTTGDTHSGVLLSNAFEFYRCPTSAKGEVDPSGFVAARLDADSYEMGVNDGVSSKTRSAYYGRSGMHLGYSGDSASWVRVSGSIYTGGFISLNNRNGIQGIIYPSSIGYWNGKLDGSAASSFYTTANESGYVDSAYVESQVSGKQDTLTFDWDADSAISSINGSALAGQGGGGAPIVVTGTAWDSSTSAYVYDLTSNLSAAERHVWTWQNGNKSDYIEYLKDDSGNRFPMMAYLLAAGAEQRYYGSFDQNGRLQFSPSKSMFTADGSNVYGLSPLTWATGASMNLSAGYFRASYRGDTIFISRGPTGTVDSSNSAQIKAVRIEAHNSRGSNISAYGASSTGLFSDIKVALGHSGVAVDESGNSSNTAASATLTTGSLTFYSAGSSDVMRQSSIPYWNAKLDASAIECDTASAITAIGGSSIGGGVDESTVSAIASSYADYATSGKVDQSAYDNLYSSYTGLSALVSQYSGWFNELSSISAKVDNSAIGVV